MGDPAAATVAGRGVEGAARGEGLRFRFRGRGLDGAVADPVRAGRPQTRVPGGLFPHDAGVFPIRPDGQAGRAGRASAGLRPYSARVGGSRSGPAIVHTA
ncbi:hypothetical protein GCM10020295_30820 [Streptomyces cinereospinus]